MIFMQSLLWFLSQRPSEGVPGVRRTPSPGVGWVLRQTAYCSDSLLRYTRYAVARNRSDFKDKYWQYSQVKFF
jgi:hypothetical protein